MDSKRLTCTLVQIQVKCLFGINLGLISCEVCHHSMNRLVAFTIGFGLEYPVIFMHGFISLRSFIASFSMASIFTIESGIDLIRT